MKIEIKILDNRLRDIGVKYATEDAAAFDLRACAVFVGQDTEPTALFDAISVRPGEVVKIGTGIAMHLGSAGGWPMAAMLLPRSGLGSKKIRLANTVGLVDADYQGEFILALENGGSTEFVIKPMDRLAQAVIVPVIRPELVVVDHFSASTARGAGAFGSTGVA